MECKVVQKNGMSVVQIDDQYFPPVAFKTFRAEDRNIRDFYKAGIRLFNILISAINNSIDIPYSLFGESWIDDEVYDFTPVDKQIDFFIERAPEAYFSLMLSIDTRDWWLKKREGYPDSFKKMCQMEADPLWREYAAKYMQAVIRHVEEMYPGKFYGYFLLGGTTTEWFSDWSYEEPSELTEQAFKKWCQNENVSVPSKKIRETERDIIFLDGEKDKVLIDYRKFAAWQRSDTILYFAKKAQEILQHKKLLGVYFGYVIEQGGPRLWNAGHLDYERVFLSEDLDMFSSPVDYGFRTQTCGSQQMITDTTLTLHNKLYFIEHDQTTCIVPDIIEGQRFVHPNKCKTIEEDINLLRRDFLLAVANGCATWWFDMFGGWFYDERFMDEITNMVRISNELFAKGYRSASEVAVIADPESMYIVNKNSSLNDLLFRTQREGLSYMGAPYDFYSACDAGLIEPKQYKLFIFLDQFQKTEKMDAWIRQLKEEGKTLLFVYAHNIWDEGYALSSMSESLGMHMAENPDQEDTMIFTDGSRMNSGIARNCYYIEETDVVLAHYEKSGKAACGYWQEGNSKVIFSGIGNLDETALRQILKLAGVHIYNRNADSVLYVSEQSIGIYHRAKNDVEILLKEDAVYEDVFDNRTEYRSENGILAVPYENSRAKLLVKRR